MNVLSLFDGISCGQVALERAGVQVDKYYASEIDKYAIQITQKNYPNTIQLGDVNGFDSWDLPRIDLIIGGSPCQDLSIAKQDRQGLDGARSGLFWRYVDCICDELDEMSIYEKIAKDPRTQASMLLERYTSTICNMIGEKYGKGHAEVSMRICFDIQHLFEEKRAEIMAGMQGRL